MKNSRNSKRRKAIKRIALSSGAAFLAIFAGNEAFARGELLGKTSIEQKLSSLVSNNTNLTENILDIGYSETTYTKTNDEVYLKCDYYYKVTYGDNGSAHLEYCNADTYYKVHTDYSDHTDYGR